MRKKDPPKLIWKKKQTKTTIPPFIESPTSSEFEPILEPEDYFRRFITDDILQLIVEQSNIYCHQTKGKALGLTKNEFEQWLGF